MSGPDKPPLGFVLPPMNYGFGMGEASDAPPPQMQSPANAEATPNMEARQMPPAPSNIVKEMPYPNEAEWGPRFQDALWKNGDVLRNLERTFDQISDEITEQINKRRTEAKAALAAIETEEKNLSTSLGTFAGVFEDIQLEKMQTLLFAEVTAVVRKAFEEYPEAFEKAPEEFIAKNFQLPIETLEIDVTLLQKLFQHLVSTLKDAAGNIPIGRIVMKVYQSSVAERSEEDLAAVAQKLELGSAPKKATEGLGSGWKGGSLMLTGRHLGDSIATDVLGGNISIKAESTGANLGARTSGGTVDAMIESSVGEHAGAEMTGGDVTVKARSIGRNAGADLRGGMLRLHAHQIEDCLGHGMRGGRIHAEGNVRHYCAGAMSGGVIGVRGNVGNYFRESASGGTGTVFGDVGIYANQKATNGKAFIFGRAGDGAAKQMQGGFFYVDEAEGYFADMMTGGDASASVAGDYAGRSIKDCIVSIGKAGGLVGNQQGNNSIINVSGYQSISCGEGEVRIKGKPIWFRSSGRQTGEDASFDVVQSLRQMGREQWKKARG